MSRWNPDVYRTYSPAECHWKLCREFIDRYRHLLSEEQVAILAHSFANSQLLMCGEADQMRRLVRELLPCRKREANAQSSLLVEMKVDVKVKQEMDCAEKMVKQEPDEVVETSKVAASYANCCLKAEKDNKIAANKNKPSIVKSNAKVVNLIPFKPVETIRTTKEIYRSLVLFDNDFQKTQHEFNKLGLGRLLVIDQEYDVGHCRSVVSVKTSVKHFPLAEAWGSTLKQSRKNVKKVFLKSIKDICYQIVSKKPFYQFGNQIERRQDPATDMEYYRSIIEEFSQQSIKLDLTFSKDFTRNEQYVLKRIARGLNLAVCNVGRPKRRKLRIIGRTIPALAIVERIVVQKDPELCELYDVILPSVVEPVNVNESS